MMKGHWTEASGYEAVTSWLRLSTSHQASIAAVLAQNDDMAIGARRALQENTTGDERSRLLSLPFLGCDGLPKSGQAYLAKGLLRATVLTPALTAQALEILERAIRSGKRPPQRTLVSPSSLPSLEVLSKQSAGVASS
jgi:ribose transport system substrate-binding protein